MLTLLSTEVTAAEIALSLKDATAATDVAAAEATFAALLAEIRANPDTDLADKSET